MDCRAARLEFARSSCVITDGGPRNALIFWRSKQTRPQVVTRAAFATRTQDNMRWTAVVQPRLVSSKSSAMLESNAVASRLNVSIRRPKLVAWLRKAPLYQLYKSGAVLMHNHPSPTQS